MGLRKKTSVGLPLDAIVALSSGVLSGAVVAANAKVELTSNAVAMSARMRCFIVLNFLNKIDVLLYQPKFCPTWQKPGLMYISAG